MKKNGIEDIYELSPTQQGMLFHTLYGSSPGVYFDQYAIKLRGRLDRHAFESAWRQTIERHEVLRTSFHWEKVEKPLQVVHRDVNLPLDHHDWRELSPEEQHERLQDFLSSDRSRGFDLRQAPLMRLALIQTGDDSFNFTWSNHHMLIDGWSRATLFREVLISYEAMLQGATPALRRGLPYRNYIAWLRQQDLAKAETYWRELLRGFGEPTPLGGTPRSANQQKHETRYAEQEISLSQELTSTLSSLARRHELTLNTLTQGAWGLLLSRYAGVDDVIFGATVSGRPPTLPNVESLVGLFINTLPVRLRLSRSQSLVSLLKTLQRQQLEMRDYEYSPLVQVQSWSEVPRGPLFESIVVFENYPVDASLNNGKSSVKIEAVEISGTTNYPLTLTIKPGAELAAHVAYDSDRFEAAAIRRLLGHFQKLLEEFATGEFERPLSTLSLLTKEERHTLLVEANNTAVAYPPAGGLHRLFEVQVDRTPLAIALTTTEERLTYAQLNVRANKLAHHLIALGVAPEDRVGILLDRSADMVVALLGVLKACGCYIPLDPQFPAERLAFMMSDAGLKVLLTTRRLAESFGASLDSMTLVYVDEWSQHETAALETNPGIEARADQLAYMIYTSGSTGQPKGVMISHGAVCNLLRSMGHDPGLDNYDRLLALTTLSFDIAGLELFLPLINGAHLILATRETASDPTELMTRMGRHDVSIVQATPATWRMLIEAGWKGVPPLKVLCGGEALPEDLAQSLRLRARSLWNMYGPTETTIWSLVSEVQCCHRVTIGRPIDNTTVYVLDEWLQPVPAGVAGNLYIGGAGLARGYWQRPALTAEKFIPNPFSSEPGDRLYLTGDVVRHLPSGELEYLGRGDHQVKVRGYRIELGEIEVALRGQAEVRAAVVVAREQKGEEKRLVAYVVAEEGTELKVSALRAALKEQLPDYMIPSAFVRMTELPLTPNGKIDRKALPAPDQTADVSLDGEAALSPVEQIVANIFGDILGLERLGTSADFFESGGHSLLATRLISRIREAFHVELPLRALFETPTIAALAAQIENAMKEAQGLVVPVIKPTVRDSEPPLSFAQQRLWFLDQLETDSPFYNIPIAVRLTGKLDLAALESAFNEIAGRHETLRTTFQTRDGRPSQVIAPSLTISLPVIDITRLSSAEQESRIKELTLAEARAPFDLAQGPLLRTTLLRLSEVEHVILVTMHHIISDGWSMRVFVRDMIALYESFVAGQPAVLPELPVQYADFALWQRKWLRGEVLDKQLAYWRKQLEAVPAMLDLPADRPRPALQTFNGHRQHFSLSPELASALRHLSRNEGATMFMALLAILNVLLHRYSRQDDILVGVPVAGRRQGVTEELIGFFVNTLVLRTQLAGEPGFRELLRRIREVALDAYTHQDVPFEKLVEELQPERNLNHQPFFQVMLVYQNVPQPIANVGTLQVKQLEIDNGVARFDLLFNLVETNDGVTGHLEYNSDLFEAETIARMLGHFTTLVESVVANPEQSISELPILQQSEQQQLVAWNNTAKDHSQTYGNVTSVHQLFEAQVEKTPDATAVVFGSDGVTYRELNSRANRLAHYLIERGVGPDVMVGLAVERSVEMIVGVLGILKAGGCYVPLDPEYPRERLKWMLEDVKLRILVSVEKMVDAFPPHGAEIVLLDAERDAIERSRDENPNVVVHDDNLFYTVFTSGSTGRPKGVASPHRCITNLIEWHNAEMVAGARTLQFASLSFDVSCYEIFICLASGGTLFVIPETLRRDTKELAKYLLANRVEKAILPVVVLQQIAEEYVALPELDHHFKEITSAGERMTVTAQVVKLFERLGPCYLRNNYGPSETHVIMAATIDGERETWPVHPPMGRQITNTEIHILDDKLQKVPVSVPGEIYIGGIALARGYINRPELTAERFLPDPFSRVPGARMYYTGDLARYLPDGQVESLGRIDHQVKIRGFRVELGEIEVVLASHPAVRELVVIAREDTPGEKKLVAYLVLEDEHSANVSELRNFLADKLPDYMVPSAFVILDEFPLSPNRKIDRRALPAPDMSRPDVETALILPRTPAEEEMANIWAGVLGLEQVGVADNFFELGGHSMLATQVVSRIRERFRVDLPLRALFQHPTVAGLVEEVARLSSEEAAADIASIPRREVASPCSLSFAQERLWFMDQFEPGSVAYNLTAGLRLEGELNVDALEQAFDEIVRRHESLRTSFTSVDGTPVQVIAPAHEFIINKASVTELPDEEREEAARQLSLTEFRKPFDLNQAPLLRVSLIKLKENEHILLMAIHHIISDGWSLGVLVREVSELYDAFAGGRPSPVAELPIQYADFAVWQREWLAGERLESQLSYWRKQLAGAPPVLELPTDFPRPATQSLRGATINLRLPASLKQELEALGRKHEATLFMVLLAAFQLLLQRYSGKNDIVVGTDIANRNRAETEPLIGFFINMLVLRSDLSGDPTFIELLGRARELALGAYAHQDTPLEKLVEELQPQRVASHSPLFQVVFVLQNAPMPSIEMPGLTVTPLNFENDTVRFDLSLLLGTNDAGDLNAMWRFRTDLFQPETITRMHRHYETLLADIVARPETRLSEFEVQSVDERRQRDAQKKELKASSFQKFKAIKPKATAPTELELVETSFLNGSTLPLVFQPRLRGVDLIDWAQHNRERVERALLKHGAVLFRNFSVGGAAGVGEFARVFAPELMDYREPSTPRSQVKDKVYTSTEYPADRTILLHNEMSYSDAWPMKVWFCCEQPAQAGGETPIADSRQVFGLLPPEIRQRLADKRVMYVRNFGDGFGLSWQTVFGTPSKEEVEAHCRHSGIEFQWKDNDRLRTWQVRQAVSKHPQTGEDVWFNQAHVHNIFSLESALRESVLSVADDQEYPLDINTAYGDGTPLEAETIQSIHHAYEQATVAFPWQTGDILMVDNMLVAHGRAPFRGPRKIVVAMAEPFSGSHNGNGAA